MNINFVKFNDSSDYFIWKKDWVGKYKEYSEQVRKQKKLVSNLHRKGHIIQAAKEQKKLLFMRVIASKSNILLKEALVEYHKKLGQEKELQEHLSKFPISYKYVKDVVFHFNKQHLLNPKIPMWVIKAKGNTFYVNHVISNAPWNTKEAPDNPHTKGSIKIKNVSLDIDQDAVATIERIN